MEELLKGNATYSIVIPLGVEQKIRLLCNEIHNVEWSGILFYTVEGDFSGNLAIKCVDLLQMDEGSPDFTSFTMSPDVASYIVDHQLFDCYQGLIHSHNRLQAFFSGTDLNTLRVEGNSMPHFVSLIVNNEGDCVAAVTRQVTVNGMSYPTWGGKKVTCGAGQKVIQYFDLEVTKEVIPEVLDRIKEIRNRKQNNKGVGEVSGIKKLLYQVILGETTAMYYYPLEEVIGHLDELYGNESREDFEIMAAERIDDVLGSMKLPEENRDDIISGIAKEMVRLLSKFKGNKYVNVFIELLNEYIL